MPETKLQKIIFGLLMSYSMAFGMEIYNIAIKMGYSGQPVSQLPAIWTGTVFKNFPMAFFWNMFAAAPFTRWAFSHIKSAMRSPEIV